MSWMVAVTGGTDDYFLPFKNVCGYLGLKLYGNHTIKQISLTGKNGEKIAGKAVVKASHTEAPVVTMDQTAAAADSIYLNCGEGVQLSTSATDPTVFWFVVPPTTFENGFTVTATTTEGRVFRHQSIKSQTISRNVCKMMPAYQVKGDDEMPNVVSTTLDKETVDVTDCDQTITVTYRITDETGVKQGAYIYLSSKNNNNISRKNITLVSGTKTDGLYTATVKVPQGSPEGTWEIRLWNLYDENKNGTSIWCNTTYLTVINKKW